MASIPSVAFDALPNAGVMACNAHLINHGAIPLANEWTCNLWLSRVSSGIELIELDEGAYVLQQLDQPFNNYLYFTTAKKIAHTAKQLFDYVVLNHQERPSRVDLPKAATANEAASDCATKSKLFFLSPLGQVEEREVIRFKPDCVLLGNPAAHFYAIQNKTETFVLGFTSVKWMPGKYASLPGPLTLPIYLQEASAKK